MPGTEQLGRGAEVGHEHGFQQAVQWPVFLSRKGKAWASPMEHESPCGAGEKGGLAKISQAGLTVAEQLNNFTEQPDKSAHIITGL